MRGEASAAAEMARMQLLDGRTDDGMEKPPPASERGAADELVHAYIHTWIA
jgi:hypothetical protein